MVEGTAHRGRRNHRSARPHCGKLFNAAKNKHQEQFQSAGKAISDKIRLYGQIGQALREAKQNGGDPFVAIEAVISWDDFAASITEAQKLRPARGS